MTERNHLPVHGEITMRLLSLAFSLALLAIMPNQALAQADPQAPIVKSAKIIQALGAKDIVLDQPGRSTATRAAPQDPSISLRVQFGFNSAELTSHGQRQLDELAGALASKALVNAGFELIGHTDQVGDADYNLRLSLERAIAVKHYLEQTHGIAAARLQTMGLGFSRLADRAHPTAPVNRRVEVRRVRIQVPTTVVQPSASLPTTRPASTGHGQFVATPK